MPPTASQILHEIDETMIPTPWWSDGQRSIWGPDGDRVLLCDGNLALRPESDGAADAQGLTTLRNSLPSWKELVQELEFVLNRPADPAPDQKDLQILREALSAFRMALQTIPPQE